MNEVEFREWIRGQLRAFDERLIRLERAPKEEQVFPVPEKQRAGALKLAGRLMELARAGRIQELVFGYMRDDGLPIVGFAGSNPVTLMGLVEHLRDGVAHPAEMEKEA